MEISSYQLPLLFKRASIFVNKNERKKILKPWKIEGVRRLASVGILGRERKPEGWHGNFDTGFERNTKSRVWVF